MFQKIALPFPTKTTIGRKLLKTMAVISFDHHTIFPLSKVKYVSPWSVTNITYLIDKFLLDEVDMYCKYIDSETPRIIDQNYNDIIHRAICGYLPDELPHVKVKQRPVEQKTFVEKLFNKSHVFQNIDDLVEFENEKWNTMQFERRINKASLPLRHNMYEIFYLSCDFIITERLFERNKYSSNNYKEDEGLLKLGYFNKNSDDIIELEELSQCAIELPEFAILYKFAKIKLREFSPKDIAGFFDYHYRNGDWSVYHYIELSNRMADELYFNKKETAQIIDYKLAFTYWLNDKVKSKKLDYNRFSESIKSKLSTEPSDQVEESKPKVKGISLSYSEIATLYFLNGSSLDYAKAEAITLFHGQTSRTSGKQLIDKYWKVIEKEGLGNRTHNREIYTHKNSYQVISKIIPLLEKEEHIKLANEYLKKSEDYQPKNIYSKSPST